MSAVYHYEVSDGVTGMRTITGYFKTPLAAVRAFELAHGPGFRGSAIVGQIGEHGEVHKVDTKGSLYPIPRGNDAAKYSDADLHMMAWRRADRWMNLAQRYWNYLPESVQKDFIAVGAVP